MHDVLSPRRGRTRRSSTIVVVMLAMALPVMATGRPADANDWPYQWPVIAPITDPFRAPANPYAPGNRGIEFATVPGSTVGAAGAGTVTFAGSVGGARWVTIQHLDGVRTSYGPLDSVTTSSGAMVRKGAAIGVAGARLHVSARIGDAYVDPAVLFGQAGVAHLVAGPRASPRPRSPAPPPRTTAPVLNSLAAPAAVETPWRWSRVVQPAAIDAMILHLSTSVRDQLHSHVGTSLVPVR